MEEEYNLPKACIAIEFSTKTSQTAIDWFTEKVKADKRKHGCQLDVTFARKGQFKYATQIIISGSNLRMKLGAELLGIRKMYKDDCMREFNLADEKNYVNYMDDDFISDGECMYIIKSELNSLRALEKEKFIPGHENVRLYPGKSILRKLKSNGYINNILCLHDETKLKKISVPWYKTPRPTFEQPLEAIHDYFGDTICMYFAFLGFYTKGLLPLIIASIPFLILSGDTSQILSYSGFAAVNIVWAAVFLELWKRKSADIAYKFGNFEKREWEEPRGSFRGKLGINPITNQIEPLYPEWKRTMRICLVSGPVIGICIGLAIALMFYYFSWDFYFAEKYKDLDSLSYQILQNVPCIIYTLLILVANGFYRRLAEWLTDRENHRLESSYQNHLITKIVLFDFVNNFLCLFYIAFIYNNVDMLRKTLRNLFIVQIVISQTLESLFPYWNYKLRSKKTKDVSDSANSSSLLTSETSEQIDLEIKRDIYSGTFDDYLELWLQFGYVTMFSCAFPFASVLAFVNNIVEIRSDAFKMCNNLRRPFSIPTRNIGAWQTAFEIISYMGVVTNCALIFMSDGFQKWFFTNNPSATSITLLLWFVGIEHLLIIARYVLTELIPSVPHYIRVAVARMHYRSVMALKRERALSLNPDDILKENLSLLESNGKSCGSDGAESDVPED